MRLTCRTDPGFIILQAEVYGLYWSMQCCQAIFRLVRIGCSWHSWLQ